MKFLAILVLGSLSMFSLSASALTFNDVLNQQMDLLQDITDETARDLNGRRCVDRYRQLFSDGVLNITIAFGYSDSAPDDTVYDAVLAPALKRAVTGPCRQGVNACEFTSYQNDPDRFFKEIEDLDGKPRRVELVISNAALSWSHKKNLSAQNLELQKRRSLELESLFSRAIKFGQEIVYYSGHSRNGGGPDFFPPVVRADGHPDYVWYKANRPGLKNLIDALSTASKSPQVLALHSCSSASHFYRRISAIRPSMAFMGYHQTVGMISDFKNLYGNLDSILGMRCETGFKKSTSVNIPIDIYKMF